ncbi:hypothetical protein OAB00_00825 [Akkermansiaceae bacterium]|nr:hypothetical protein [Akkermansiaceae bacterium]
MPEYPLHSDLTAPSASKQILKSVEEEFGMIPNLEKTLAASPPALEAYTTLWSIFEKTSLTSIEQQVVYQTANLHHQCVY